MVNIIRMNGTVIFDVNESVTFTMEKKEHAKVEKFLGHLERNKKAYLSTAYALALLTLPGNALAAGGLSGGVSLIVLLQKASFWVGLAITIWGIVEMQLGAPDWKWRVFKGVAGYVLILIVPLLFLELQNSLQADVWEQIQKSTEGVKVNGG